MPTKQDDRDPLLRAGNVYTSKSGTSLVGSINLTYFDRDGSRFGDRLIAMIEEAMQRGVALRALLFPPFEQEDAGGSGPAYRLHFGFGQPKPQEEQNRHVLEPPRASTDDISAPHPSTMRVGYYDPNSQAGLPAPEPTPRRRVPPSRGSVRSGSDR